MTIRRLAAISLLVFSTIAANDVAPSNAELEAMYDSAFRAFDAADYTQALKELDAIDARKPDLAASQNLRGVIYMRQGIYDKAEAALSESQRLDPKFWNARFNLAEIPFLKKDWPAARKRFQELLSNNGADLQGEATQLIQYKILLTYLLEGNETMVDSIVAKFELSPDTPAVHYANAAIALQKQNVPDARNWVSTAEKNFSPQLNKLFAESLFEVGWLQQQPGQQRTALQLLNPEERANGTKAMAQSQLEQAQQAYEQRDFTRASKLAEQADAAQPDQPAFLNLRGEILLEQGKFSEAEQFFSKALKTDSKFREAQFNLADVPFRQKDYPKARDRFQALLKQTPGGDKNQAAQLINFKIFMTYLLEGKDSRAQGMMEQFQFSGDTPALYYAEAAWAFKHGKADKANDWITSARKIYPLASNAAYGSGFYDLGWLTGGPTAPSSPAPSAAVDAAAVAAAQNESPAPSAVEPSPIPGVEAKTEETGFVSAQRQPSPVPGMEGSSPAAKANEPSAKSPLVASAGSPARPQDAPALPISPVVEMPSASATGSVPASAAPVNTPVVAQASAAPGGQNAASPVAPAVAKQSAAPLAASSASASPVTVAEATPAAALAPAKGGQFVQPGANERLQRFADPRTILSIVLLVGGLGIIAWVGILEIRRRMNAPHVGRQAAPATGPDLHSASETEKASLLQTGQRFSGGPRQISVQLKASEPSLRRSGIGLAKAAPEQGPPDEPPVEEETQPAVADDGGESFDAMIAQTPPATSPNGEGAEVAPSYDEEAGLGSLPEAQDEEEPVAHSESAPAWEPVSRFADLEESVGPVIEQAPESMPEPIPASMALDNDLAENGAEDEAILGSLRASEEVTSPEEVFAEPDPFLAEAAAEETTSESVPSSTLDEPSPEFRSPTIEVKSEIEPMVEPPTAETPTAELPDMSKSSKKSKESPPSPEPVAQGQPVPYQTIVEKIDTPAEEVTPAEEAELRGVSTAIAGLGSLRGAMPPAEEEKEFSSQPTTIQHMPETQTAPVIRTSAGSNQPSGAPPPVATAGGIHTAVHITLSCEIASMQLTPTFKMGALQLRPMSKVVTMRLAPSQEQQQNGMNLANFEIAKVQPAPGSLGQIRLSPSQQQKPATLNTPSFNISGLQVVSGFEAAPLQLTPSQQGQASVHLTAAFQITTVEFSPTFDVAAMILNSSSKTVSVRLPAAAGGGGDNGPLFEITNVQLTANGDIGMLQLNPATARRT